MGTVREFRAVLHRNVGEFDCEPERKLVNRTVFFVLFFFGCLAEPLMD